VTRSGHDGDLMVLKILSRAGSDRFIYRNRTILRMSLIEQIHGRMLAQHIRMRMKDLTSRVWSINRL
jgi:hypothetical protein